VTVTTAEPSHLLLPRLLLVVSDRSINRFVTNDFKRLREADRARELADHLVRNGARAG
jgi:hypothetical protein